MQILIQILKLITLNNVLTNSWVTVSIESVLLWPERRHGDVCAAPLVNGIVIALLIPVSCAGALSWWKWRTRPRFNGWPATTLVIAAHYDSIYSSLIWTPGLDQRAPDGCIPILTCQPTPSATDHQYISILQRVTPALISPDIWPPTAPT